MARKGAMRDARRGSTDNTPLNLFETCVFVVKWRMASGTNYGTAVLCWWDVHFHRMPQNQEEYRRYKGEEDEGKYCQTSWRILTRTD